MDLNESEYVENSGDHFFKVENIFDVDKVSIFIDFLKINFFENFRKIAGAGGAGRVAL